MKDSSNEQFQLAHSRMAFGLKTMVHRYPLNAEWLSPNIWNRSPMVGTMAVTVHRGRPQFYYDADFVCSCSAAELEGVIHHELNHLAFGHPFLNPALFPNRDALVIAEEVTVNEYVDEPLPGSPLLLQDFPELPPLEDTPTRYDRLKDRTDLSGLSRTLDLHAWLPDARGSKSLEEKLEAVKQALIFNASGSPRRAGRRRPPVFRHPARFAGEVLRLVSEQAGRREIDWQRVVEKHVGQSARREAVFHRPPRRMPQLVGVVPGTVSRRVRPRVLAAIDTSSSMEPSDFGRIRYELVKLDRFAEATVVECDQEIRRWYPFRGTLDQIQGRGGTDLRPVLDPKWLASHSVELVLYFTDGQGRAPKSPPPVNVVWCLTGQGKRPAPWGDMIQLDAG